jgi:hypothetical protein
MENMRYPIFEEARFGKKVMGIVDAPFDEGLFALSEAGYQIASGEYVALERRLNGVRHSVSTKGSYVKEDIVYIPGENPILTRGLAIIPNAGEATQAHKLGSEFYVRTATMRNIEKFLKEDKKKAPECRRVYQLENFENFEIPTDSFKDSDLARFEFGRQAKAYGNFLNKKAGIALMQVILVTSYSANKQCSSFARQLQFGRLELFDRFVLNGANRELGYNCVRGVKDVFAKGDAPKESVTTYQVPYTQKQLDKAVNVVEGVRSGIVGVSRLESALKFLSQLKIK